MATIREYFDTDLNKYLSAHFDWQIQSDSEASPPPIRARISQDFDVNAKYWSFFILEGADVVGYVNAIFRTPETSRCVLFGESDSICVEMGFADYSERATSKTLVFTQRNSANYGDSIYNSGEIWITRERTGFLLLAYLLKAITYQGVAAVLHRSSLVTCCPRRTCFTVPGLLRPQTIRKCVNWLL